MKQPTKKEIIDCLYMDWDFVINECLDEFRVLFDKMMKTKSKKELLFYFYDSEEAQKEFKERG